MGADYGFDLPETGGSIFVDNVLIPAGAEHKANAEKIRTRENESILCDCGRYYKRCMRSRHAKTEIHKQNINRVMFSQFLDL